MNYEKAYKEALERAKSKIENDKGHVLYEDDIKEIFPELVESEGERIRKEILNVVKQLDENSTICGEKHNYNKWIAWLEKQGEQKSSCDERIRKALISILKSDFDKDTTIYGISVSNIIAWLENQGKKDSQVILPTFTFDDILALQCCMQAMSKNDELYKKLQSIHDRLHEVYGLEKQGEYKSTWDEEDEKFVVDTINVLYRAKNQYAQTARLEECIDWLKSLKYRIKGE